MNKPAVPLSDELVEGLDRLRGEQGAPQDLTAIVEAAVREYLKERGITTTPRGLRITPADMGSGLTDVSLDHDRYLSRVTSAVLADTGPLYAAVDIDDGMHPRALDDLVRLVDHGLNVIVAGSTLLECYTLVVQRLGPTVASRWLNEIETGAQIVQPSLDDLTAAADLTRSHADRALTMFDAVYVVLSNRLSIPVWTYDERFAGMKVTAWG